MSALRLLSCTQQPYNHVVLLICLFKSLLLHSGIETPGEIPLPSHRPELVRPRAETSERCLRQRSVACSHGFENLLE